MDNQQSLVDHIDALLAQKRARLKELYRESGNPDLTPWDWENDCKN